MLTKKEEKALARLMMKARKFGLGSLNPTQRENILKLKGKRNAQA